MSPAEKSNELLRIYEQHMSPYARGKKQRAKECAIICVEQIIDLPVCWYSKELADKNDEDCPHSATEEYWQEVLSHLKNS